MKQDHRFVSGRVKSVKYAVRGAYKLITSEHSVMVQFFTGVLTVIAGLYFDISRTDWMFQILAIALVLAVEGLNTAIEKIADFVQPEFDEKIGFIKDVAAGAVLFAAAAALAIGCMIYGPIIMAL